MISVELRNTVRTLYAFACGYCGITETEVGASLTVDHFKPRDAGGLSEIDNLVYACFACNLHKSKSWNPDNPPLLHPLQTDLSFHIQAGEDGQLTGLTDAGRLHIETLHLNRPRLVEHRRQRLIWERIIARDTRENEKIASMEQEIEMLYRRIRQLERQRR